MARITVATSHPPFAQGGHLVIANGLVAALRTAGHDAALLLTPQNRFGRQASAYLATWLTDVGLAHDGKPVDQVISLRFPSYAVRHPVHACWLNHRMREYYDQWPRFSSSLSTRARLKETIRRRLIHAADRYLLTRNVTHLFAQSETIQKRLRTWGDIASRVVYPPAPPREYRCEDYDDFVLVVSRLTPLKRVGLVVDALTRPEADGVKCVVVGDGEELPSLRQTVADRALEGRVTFLGAVDDEELLTQLSRCRAVCFPAQHEDYGLVTAEAFASGKAVVTCTDSGGPAELVRDGDNGFVTEPDAASVATALARLSSDRGLAERLGASSLAQASQMTWERAIDTLVVV